MTWYDVTSVYSGGLDVQEQFRSEDDAMLFAEEQAAANDVARIKNPEATWEVYVTPHYCDPSDTDAECVCVQYLTDHHPTFSSKL